MGGAEGSQRVAEVTPFALLFILLGQWLRVALDCHTTLGAPKNNTKPSNNNQLMGEDAREQQEGGWGAFSR